MMDINHMCESWIGAPLEQAIEEAQFILHTERHLSLDTIELLVDSLLTAVSMQGADASTSVLKRVVDTILNIGGLHASTVGSVLLNHMSLLPQPIPFVAIFPTIFGMASPLLLQEAFEQLQSLLSVDNQFILPVINALVDLPLTASLKGKLVSLTEEAIAIVDECDIPFLFRTLLNNLENTNTTNIAGKILTEVFNASTGYIQ